MNPVSNPEAGPLREADPRPETCILDQTLHPHPPRSGPVTCPEVPARQLRAGGAAILTCFCPQSAVKKSRVFPQVQFQCPAMVGVKRRQRTERAGLGPRQSLRRGRQKSFVPQGCCFQKSKAYRSMLLTEFTPSNTLAWWDLGDIAAALSPRPSPSARGQM